MTPRQQLKKCLMKGWLNGNVCLCVAMVLIDYKRPWSKNNSTLVNFPYIEDFMREVGMPLYPWMRVSTYIAHFYPKASDAIFNGNPNAFRIFCKETQRTGDPTKSLRYEHRKEARENKMTKFISLRGLSKKHDWNTVK